MKIIAVILSVYVMALTAMPCTDVFAADTNSVSIELSEQNHNHSDTIDLCTPFCFCCCCQTLSQTDTDNTLPINLEGLDLTIPALVVDEMVCTTSFWQPPKI